MLRDNRVILLLASMFCIGVVLQLLGCVIWNNWWPMLNALVLYVLVPMPYLFFGAGSGDGYSIYSTDLESGWVDAGKFLTGFSAVASIAIPAILFHAQRITVGALVIEIIASIILGAAALDYEFFSANDSGYY
eukprot:TRINITY_DN72038_c0_g1_i1.p2 TRINITY_DN72038_c0_g1~~TRINITY_DN72038_c0_g1_i1.p2  ORF type:complete len:133 (-),score=13.96 TRINITY_DN72038_c0_g1_i1:244-642(-)